MFNWQELDREDILYWILPHVLADHQVAELSLASAEFTAVEVKFLINGIEFDGEKLIRDLYASMSKSFDRAVAEKAHELSDLTALKDLADDIVKGVRLEVNNRLKQAGIEPVSEADFW